MMFGTPSSSSYGRYRTALAAVLLAHPRVLLRDRRRRASAWNSSMRARSASSAAARMRTASRPALRALPTATVATGMPGRHLHDREQRVEPVEVLERDRDADHRQRGHRRGHPGQVRPRRRRPRRSPAARAPAAVRAYSYIACGRAVRRDDAHLARHVELGERVDRALHHGEIGVAAHDHADDRSARSHVRDVSVSDACRLV